MPEVDAQATPGTTVDPYRTYNFAVVIDGSVEGRFTSVSGLEMRVTPIKYREGGNPGAVRYIPGQVEYSAITLNYGLTGSDDLWNWMLASVNGEVQRRELSVVMYDSSGTREVMRWNLTRAFPVAWAAAELDAMSTSVAIEALTLVYEGIERDSTAAPSGQQAATPAGE